VSEMRRVPSVCSVSIEQTDGFGGKNGMSAVRRET